MQRITFSQLRAFRDCRKKAQLRYEKLLSPLAQNSAMHFGSIIHECLERWHTRRDLEEVLSWITAQNTREEINDLDAMKAKAMMSGYAAKYARETFEPVALEHEFCRQIHNPATGCASRTFELAGKVDGVIKSGGYFHLLEHKTAARVDAAYIERLGLDPQIALYLLAMQDEGIQVSGVMYNVLLKPGIRQGKNETIEKFDERLIEWHEREDVYARFMIYPTQAQMRSALEDLWLLAKEYRRAQLIGAWPRNPSQCYTYNRPCSYFALCSSGENSVIENNFYAKREQQHSELEASND